jgi:hypothetical protein
VLGDYYTFILAQRLMGKKGALIFNTYSIFNRRINEIFQRTMTNGVEAVMCMIAFYYYSSIKYQKDKGSSRIVFEKNLAAMTFAITLAFLIRSSSLIGWIPLALFKIISTKDVFSNLLAIIQAGIFVSLPTILISILLDSLFYG